MSKEQAYIKKRKRQAFFNGLAFYACRIFPIKRNRISVCAFEGRSGFCCNPKYIVEEMHRRHPDYEFVWFVNDMEKQFPDYIKKVPNTLWSRAYWLSTSKVWIDNY
ncbi:MAG: CDP-glycerol glycerophosphotransferase family protein, partial [Agathobacter sp.]|nr:CDP-glycerol glycerophosphotransferase family protein [Agathobacter sp.]